MRRRLCCGRSLPHQPILRRRTHVTGHLGSTHWRPGPRAPRHNPSEPPTRTRNRALAPISQARGAATHSRLHQLDRRRPRRPGAPACRPRHRPRTTRRRTTLRLTQRDRRPGHGSHLRRARNHRRGACTPPLGRRHLRVDHQQRDYAGLPAALHVAQARVARAVAAGLSASGRQKAGLRPPFAPHRGALGVFSVLRDDDDGTPRQRHCTPECCQGGNTDQYDRRALLARLEPAVSPLYSQPDHPRSLPRQ